MRSNLHERFLEREIDCSLHLQERMKDSQEQLQLLTQQMNQLMQEKAELETRNKILEQVVRLNVEHVDQLQTNKVGHPQELKIGFEAFSHQFD